MIYKWLQINFDVNTYMLFLELLLCIVLVSQQTEAYNLDCSIKIWSIFQNCVLHKMLNLGFRTLFFWTNFSQDILFVSFSKLLLFFCVDIFIIFCWNFDIYHLTFGDKSVRVLNHHIFNQLPKTLKRSLSNCCGPKAISRLAVIWILVLDLMSVSLTFYYKFYTFRLILFYIVSILNSLFENK